MFISVFYLISHDAFAQNETQKTNVYEGLGLKMKYFDPWEIGLKFDDPSCLILCSTTITTPDFEGTMGIIQYKFDDPDIKNNCKCDTLLDFVKYKYESFSKDEDLVFINDNQTTLTDGNITAIQMEYEKKTNTMIGENLFHIFIKGPNSFYNILFFANKNEQQYSKYLDDFKKMLNSLEFVSANETKKKQPSFMLDTNESNDSSPISNLTNDNALDLSNNGKQQSSESLESNNKIGISSHNSYINSIGHLHVIGEVENNSPLIAEFVKIIGTFYDDNGNVVGTSYTYSNPNDISSGEKAPFDLILSDSTIPVDQIKEYRLTITSR
jgi:hypothetical protein